MLSLHADRHASLQIVCIGAHCDDIEIGCGGALISLAQAYPQAVFHCWVFSGQDARALETRNCLGTLLGEGRMRLQQLSYRDGFFPAQWSEIKQDLHRLSQTVRADLVFTHTVGDSHQDHNTLAELTWNHFRSHTVLEYEIVKYEGDLQKCNVYIPLTTAQMRQKVDALISAFPTQAGKHWFTASTFEAILRLRGIECHAESGYAEGFVGRKTVLQLASA